MKELGHYPIDSHLQDISDALRTNNTCLIKAEPGAGKTTRVPLHLLDSVEGEILVLEPRRLAARLSAERSAWFLDEKCGLKVGYRISQDKKVSRETRLTFITEGLFVRLLRDNPTLNTIGAVVLDEFHERNIHTDIALTLIRNLQHSKRPDLKLIVMSATLDSSLLENYLNSNNDKKNDNKNDNNTDNNTDTNAKKIKTDVFDIKGRSFPVEIEYITEGKSAWRIEKNWEDRVAMAVNKMVNDPRCPGNILVFLTGIGDIMIAKRRLERLFKPGEFSILPLAAGLPLKEQQRIFEETGPRKIVLSTNVAETSLTIPGITGVIDLGFAKLAAHAPWSGMPTLEVKRISQASAVQRGG
ncbi:MAG: ATP-dependent RNA helicase, partial [bacterium]|nr:ATP-dependent RNA helicase [bacterium]